MIRDLRAQKLQLQQIEEAIPAAEDRLENLIKRRARLEAIIAKLEAQELAKNHTGLCGVVGPPHSEKNIPCERFYKHTGLHSWEGGGVG